MACGIPCILYTWERKGLSNWPSSKRMFESQEVSILGKEINYHHDAVRTLWGWKPFNKIHGYNRPGTVGNWQWLQEAGQLGTVRLSLLADNAGSDKRLNCWFHASLGKDLFQTAICDCHAWVSTDSSRVHHRNQLSLQLRVSTHPDTELVTQQPITKSEVGYRIRGNGQLGKQFLRSSIVRVGSCNTPGVTISFSTAI